MGQILKRLELLKACISLQDHGIIAAQVSLLRDFDDEKINQIADLIEDDQYHQAMTEIEGYIKCHTGITIYEDPEVLALKSELNILGNKLASLEVEQEEIVNLLRDFQLEYHNRVGSIVTRILQLKKTITESIYRKDAAEYRESLDEFTELNNELKKLKQKLQKMEAGLEELEMFSPEWDKLSQEIDELERYIRSLKGEYQNKYQDLKQKKKIIEDGSHAEYKDAEADFDDFSEEHETYKNEVNHDLTDEELKELKKLYRQASKLCHPDKVSEEHKQKATEMMVEVNRANKEKDLVRMKELVAMLKKGQFDSVADSVTTKDELIEEVLRLREKLKQKEIEIFTLKASESWNNLLSIDCWQSYFDTLEIELTTVMEVLEEQLQEV
ncbi:hypothetical protein ITG08_20405 [Vibrio cyclitrophicus]|uniref:J domain-containing protein n=1 Tax=Vibrio cyclitrophicus TaxID=47951 RepID=UPI00204F9BC7|nr:J domain-containing protein [Vibrio cyclitrophicus]UPR26975.1 hypothetical protein ITG08_20405 [Vibrio cyclitrophicus]